MGVFRTSDGFEFETVREPGRIRCDCRRGEDAASVIITSKNGEEPGPQLLELAEVAARDGCIAARTRREREERQAREE